MWKYYCNISQIGYFILYIISLFSLFISPIRFFFSLRYLLHTRCISIPTPFFSFFSLIQVSSTPTFFSKKILQHSLFFSLVHSLWFFFFFFFHTLSLYLYPPSFICFLSLMRSSHSPTLSLCFFSFFIFFIFFYFFLNLILEGIMDKVFFISFPLKLFLPIWGDEICGPGRENFLSGFPLFLFSSLSQTVENTVFYSVFRSMFSILFSTQFSTLCFPSPLKSPQPNTV